MKKTFGRVLSLLTTAAMACSVLLSMPVSAANSLPVKVEAEACTLGDGAKIATSVYGTNYPGYSGDGFVWASNSGTISMEVTVPENAMYELKTRCWMYLGEIGESRLQVVTVNGVSQGNFYIPNKGGWMDYSFGFFFLKAGTTKIEIGSSGSWGFILYDTVTFDYADMPDLDIDPTPCDANATSETKSLKNYLTSVYGNYVISGQQEIYGGGNDGNSELEFDYIHDKTGKYPAIRGFDLMNYNPMYGWEDGTTQRIIEWTKERGGIATASWHITIPSDFTSYKLGEAVDWTKTSYKPNKTFNAANCLDKSTKEYAYLMLAIDDLAEQLLILQDANVPLLFRPFHEAEGNNNTDGSGAWFWWGSSGAEVYKQLWKLLYTTLTEKYGIHNIIWEVNLYLNANSPQWYPGDDCVDIVAYDKYEGSPYTWKTSAATSAFLTLVNDTKDTKMVALTENDVIPDIQNIVNEGAWWLYFCPWYGEFLTSSRYNDPTLLKTIYNSQYVLTLDELPENLYGGNTGTVTPTPTKTSTPTVTPTPSNGVLGDLNSDGSFNSIDFGLLRSHLLTLTNLPVNLTNGDVDGNGQVNSLDFAYMRQKLLGIISKFPIE
ncbi:glycosyl hydrolase [Acetivibrio cellulolyticus]|uniref:glycosyl hydrolase n=1 Tax=Acetivibrio cellulolyticus TaxID=35830 RepID=UPI0001E2BD56|nr:glycosyl hydrolase [Acetivibrio cellulolyticus]